jgi:hypothetical protein
MPVQTILHERIEEQSFAQTRPSHWYLWVVVSGVEGDFLQLRSDHASAILHIL